MLSKREEVGLIVWLEAGYDYRGDLGKGLCVSAMFRLSLTIACTCFSDFGGLPVKSVGSREFTVIMSSFLSFGASSGLKGSRFSYLHA